MSYFNSTVYDCLLGIRFGKDEKNRLTDKIKFPPGEFSTQRTLTDL